MPLNISSYGLKVGQSPISNLFGENKDHTAKLLVNGKSIDIKSKEESLPPYLQELRKRNEEMKYDNIMLKAENGEDLTPAELAAIKEKNPELYQQLLQEIQFQKQFEHQLKNCKNKKEAQEYYLNTQLTVGRMCGAKGNSGYIPEANRAKYNRLMKRIHKSYEKYLAGKLDSKNATKLGKASTLNPLFDITSEMTAVDESISPSTHYDEKI